MPSQKTPKGSVKQSKLDQALERIVHRYGAEVVKQADEVERAAGNSIPTGSLSLDFATGVGVCGE